MKKTVLGIILVWFIISGTRAQLWGQLTPPGPERELARQLLISRANIGFGARALAMGGAFTALADDITAMCYNPAGLAQLIKPEVSLGGSFTALSVQDPSMSLSNTASPLSVDYAGIVIPFKLGMPMAVGASYQNRMPDELRMDYEYFNKQAAESSGLFYDNSGGIWTGTLCLAVRPLEFLFIGANLNFNRMDIKDSYGWDRTSMDYSNGTMEWTVFDSYMTYQFDLGVSYDFGLLMKFKRFSIGAIYKNAWHERLATTYHWQWALMHDPGMTEDRDYSDYATLYWPYSINTGISFRPIERLTLALDYSFTRWSEGHIEYEWYTAWDEIYNYPLNGPQDTTLWRGGAEYVAFYQGIAFPFRAGAFTERAIGLDASGNPVRFSGITCGTGIAFKHFVFDFATAYRWGHFDADTGSGLQATDSSDWRILFSLTVKIGK